MAAIINIIATLLRLLEDVIKRRREQNEAKEVQARHDAYLAERDKLDKDPAGWFRGHFSGPDRGMRIDVPAGPPDGSAKETESGDNPVP